jgi:hypothetical protein
MPTLRVTRRLRVMGPAACKGGKGVGRGTVTTRRGASFVRLVQRLAHHLPGTCRG